MMAPPMNGHPVRSDSPPIPVRAGRWVRLIPATPNYYDFLYSLVVDEEVGYRWRFAGSVPAREAFDRALWNNVLAQFIVVSTDNGAPLNLVQAYNAELSQGFTYAAQVMSREATGTGVGAEAFYLFAGYLFRVLPLRKLYLDVPEYNLPLVSSRTIPLRSEGRLREHSHYDGRLWDRVILALYRQDYDAIVRLQSGRLKVPEMRKPHNVKEGKEVWA
jgi:hypothetical protein